MDRFAQILYDLGKEINVDLYPDENRLCQVNFQELLRIQLQYEEQKERLLIATFICEVPPGKYRETLLKEALKSNEEYPRIGTLSYSQRNNQLTLFDYIYGDQLKAEKLFEYLKAFLDKAILWQEAVEKGRPLPTTLGPSGKDKGIFGLKP